MDKLFLIILVALSFKMLLLFYRVVSGPTLFDRLTGLGVMATDIILLLVLLGFVSHRVDVFVDISIAYAILGFMGLVLLARYFERKGDIEG